VIDDIRVALAVVVDAWAALILNPYYPVIDPAEFSSGPFGPNERRLSADWPREV
jgi:hypothetical protein